MQLQLQGVLHEARHLVSDVIGNGVQTVVGLGGAVIPPWQSGGGGGGSPDLKQKQEHADRLGGKSSPGPSINGGGSSRAARLLQQSLRGAIEHLDLEHWKRNIIKVSTLEGLITLTHSNLSPKGPGTCDHNPRERCANCVTSAPYLACGVHALRNRKTLAGKLWGLTLVGVSGASCTFHASTGKARPHCRKLDFWMISVASTIMLRAAFPRLPKAVTAAGLCATPFSPFLVSTLSTSAMEVKYIGRAHRNKKLHLPITLHAFACVVGLTCFALEDLRPEIPFMHAAWHCLSASATATINPLLADVETNLLGLGDKT